MEKSNIQPQGETYKDCGELPFLNFIELSTTGDTKWLIKSGAPGNLDEIAVNIQSEYTELSADSNANEALELSSQIEYFKGRLFIAKTTIAQLQVRRVEGLVDVLRNEPPDGLGLPFTYDDLTTDLERSLTYMMGEQLELNQLEAQAKEKVTTNTGKATKKDWLSRLMAIDKYRKSAPTNPANISTLQFIIMDTDFAEYVAYLKSTNNAYTGD